MAEEGPWLPLPAYATLMPLLGQGRHLDYGGEGSERSLLQVVCAPPLKPEQPQEHPEIATLKLPKMEETTNSGLPVAAMETPSDLVGITRTRLPPPLPFSSRAPPLPAPLPVSFRSVDLRGTARPTPQQLMAPSTQSRGKRRGIGERVRMLAKLMPWDRKMTTSSMLEEARNYVKFLEAQVAALQCMPVESRFGCPPPSSYAAAAPMLRGLERLNRQQLLHVLVRSPLVQDKLCARGLCVFAAEQLILLRQAADEMLHHHQQQQRAQQMVLDSGSTSTISD